MTASNSISQLCLVCLLLLIAVLFLAVMSPGLVAAVGSIGPVDLADSHGPAKHGISAAETIRKCLDRQGPTLEWLNIGNGRRARVCEFQPGKWGIQIVKQDGGIWKEVTVFVKEKLTSIEQVMRYLRNTGYGPIN